MKKSFGKATLGGGNKMSVYMHGYGRSTHNLNKVVRTTMNVGTLIPLYTNIGLNGDTWNIDLNALIKTKPAIAPLFGTYKYQVDVFECPIKNYISALHNNPLNVGMNMDKVKIPQIVFTPNQNKGIKFSASSLMAYLGKRGIAPNKTGDTEYCNALPLLSYYDIFKNYYANKQENMAYVIGPTTEKTVWQYGREITYTNNQGTSVTIQLQDTMTEQPFEITNDFQVNKNIVLKIEPNSTANKQQVKAYGSTVIPLDIFQDDIKTAIYKKPSHGVVSVCGYVTAHRTPAVNIYTFEAASASELTEFILYGVKNTLFNNEIKLESFELENIDTMRETILNTPFYQQLEITSGNAIMPYSMAIEQDINNNAKSEYRQDGICVKTFQSDIFQNWLNTEWVEGVNGISEVTKVDTSNGLNLDALNLAQKVYNMLNRIAVSGGSWHDWQDAVYGVSTLRSAENPIYHGGMSCRIGFEEVTSNASANDAEGDNQPLGTLAGKGQMFGKKGGRVTIHVKEPCVIMVIASITPFIDYSQGNKWYMEELKTINDLHKPALDGIGFQNLPQYQLNALSKKGINIGKSPAWIHYMTDVNEVYGDFAVGEKERYMVLQKEYYLDSNNDVLNSTTYIDPTQFNYTFADTTLGAQNFWVQQAFDIKCRRIMSAKVIPNL